MGFNSGFKGLITHGPCQIIYCINRLYMKGNGKGKDTSMHSMMAYGGVEVWRHSFLASTIGGGEWSASHFGRPTLLEKSA